MIVMAKKPRKQCRVTHRPHCPEHGDSMLSYKSEPEITRYKCTVLGCKHTAKVERVFLEQPTNDGSRGHSDRRKRG